ncbi:MAG: hypothetical protein KA312_05965 [Sphingorhabdus sp.]|nr:hypothetical protein [Sphingorhabdus sp.]
MPLTNLPDADHIVRYVPWTKVEKDADDNVLGVLAVAYQRREGEEALSVNWLERVGVVDELTALRETLSFMQSTLNVGKKGRLAISNVADFKGICAKREQRVRIIHAPVDGNEPHSEVRQIPREDLQLLEEIASAAVKYHLSCGELMG